MIHRVAGRARPSGFGGQHPLADGDDRGGRPATPDEAREILGLNR
jgi:hypothetical protein